MSASLCSPRRAPDREGKDPQSVPCTMSPEVWGSRVGTARFGEGGPPNRAGRRNGRLERQKVPRRGQGKDLWTGAVG